VFCGLLVPPESGWWCRIWWLVSPAVALAERAIAAR
jgi:hypothetical protein